WPWPAAATVGEGSAVILLAVTVMGVTIPAGTTGEIGLQRGIHHTDRILDQAIVSLADTVAHQFEKAGVNDRRGGKISRLARGPVADADHAVIRIFVGGRCGYVRGSDSDVMARDSGHDHAPPGDRPRLQMRLDKIGEIGDETR